MTTQIGKTGFNTEKVKGLSLSEMREMFPNIHPKVIEELHRQVGSKSKKGKKSKAKVEAPKED